MPVDSLDLQCMVVMESATVPFGEMTELYVMSHRTLLSSSPTSQLIRMGICRIAWMR